MPGKNKSLYLSFCAITAIFAFICYKGLLIAQPGDENVYFYMGRLISEGKIPYKDFFYAHPPLHIYLLALVYGVFGFKIAVLKLVPFASALVTSFFILKIAKEKFGNFEGIAAAALFLFSYAVMFNSAFSFGIMTATMLLTIGYYYLAVKNKYLIAGIFFGLAGITRLLALLPIAVFLAAAFLSNRKNFIKLSSSFLSVFLLANLFFLAISGGAYIDSVYKYHFLKTLGPEQNFAEYRDVAKLNWVLFFSAALFVFAKEKRNGGIFAIVPIVYLISLAFLKKLYGFYFIVAFPFLAILGAYSIANIYRRIKLRKSIKFLAAALLLLAFMWNLSSDALFLRKVGFKGFERGNDLAGFISSNSNQNTMLFGDESIVPLLALITGKKIALDAVDTNIQVFELGLIDISQVLQNMNKQEIIFIARNAQGIAILPEVRNFLNKDCEFLSQFHDKSEGDYLIYRC